MKLKLPCGKESTIQLEISSEALQYQPRQDILPNLTFDALPQAVFDALESPLDFPPLRECLLDDDTLAIPVATGVPHLETILRSVLDYVFTASELHRPARVVIIGTAKDKQFMELTPEKIVTQEEYRERVKIHKHRPEVKEEMAFLGVTETNETLVIQRELFEAEFVLPIGFFLPKNTPGYVGIHTPIYPMFSDSETQKRFLNFGPQMRTTQHSLMHELEREIVDATRQLGVLCALQILPGVPEVGASGVARILAGNYYEVEREGYSQYQEIWNILTSRRYDLSLTTITGRDSDSWRVIMLALQNAAQMVESENGVIVLCTDTIQELPRSLEIYRQVQNPETATKFIRREKLLDADLAVSTINILSQRRVFFLSQFDGELLEDINIIPLESVEDLQRLIANTGNCAILPNAHLAIM